MSEKRPLITQLNRFTVRFEGLSEALEKLNQSTVIFKVQFMMRIRHEQEITPKHQNWN